MARCNTPEDTAHNRLITINKLMVAFTILEVVYESMEHASVSEMPALLREKRELIHDIRVDDATLELCAGRPSGHEYLRAMLVVNSPHWSDYYHM
jgi:hypothetical protein